MILSNKSLTSLDIIRNLGMRFRDYRMCLNMTRKEIAEAAGVGLTTIYKFESGKMTDISFDTLLRLLRAIGLSDNWDKILPDLAQSPYLYDDNYKKRQRIRHNKNELP